MEQPSGARPLGGLGRAGSADKAAAEVMVPVCAFQMVGLSEVQANLAQRWPELAEKVHATAQAIIARHLVRGDVFERRGDDGYLVLFATLGAKEAEFKSRVIAREIAQRLLGEGEGAERLEVTARCAEVSADALASGDCEIAVDMALAQATNAPLDAPGAAVAPPQAVVASATAVSMVRSYSPVWDTEQMTLLRFRGYIPREPPGAMEDRAREAAAFQQDLAVVRAVAGDLQVLARQNRRLPTTIAIDHASLGVTSQRASLRHALSNIPASLRKFVTLEICGPQEAFWTYGCKAFLEMTKPLGVGVSALVPLEQTHLIPASGTLKVVATDLSDMDGREAQALAMLAAFASVARAQGLDACAYGLNSRALVLGAVGAGFRYLAGSAIHPDVGALASALRFEPSDLYADMTRSPPPAR
ncbi:hypothetical protein [Phenylobacterium sp.]|uniref:hypothetical protein n=1 Tax=Phenylobacterium sp. TaxID=1871053 RepID=UPI002C30BD16|nr:hypothetical protein [Phenylobacterium sp.]HLZ74190.1 hypothetical protein [Phenylobacterium sp.]